jgi:hypothetical protein
MILEVRNRERGNNLVPVVLKPCFSSVTAYRVPVPQSHRYGNLVTQYDQIDLFLSDGMKQCIYDKI